MRISNKKQLIHNKCLIKKMMKFKMIYIIVKYQIDNKENRKIYDNNKKILFKN